MFAGAGGDANAPGRSYPAKLPLLRLDRIYVRGLSVASAAVHSGSPWSKISDHAAPLGTPSRNTAEPASPAFPTSPVVTGEDRAPAGTRAIDQAAIAQDQNSATGAVRNSAGAA